MKAEIWFFFTPDGQSEITVLNRESAVQLAKLLSENLQRYWKVRKNRSSEIASVFECKELWDGEVKSFHKSIARPTPEELPAPRHQNVPDELSLSSDFDGVLVETNAGQIKRIEPKHEEPKAQGGFNSSKGEKTHTKRKVVRDGSEKRKHERFELKLRVVLIAGNKSFRTFSKNVSKGGMSFEHVVPKDLIGKDCRVIVGSADFKENLEFDARLAGDPYNPRAVEFRHSKEQFVVKLDSWLKEIKNKAA